MDAGEAFATAARPCTTAELFGDLHRGLFSEVTAPRPAVDPYRRNVQRLWVDQMDRLVNTPFISRRRCPPGFGGFPGFVPPLLPPGGPADARALARAASRTPLVALDARARARPSSARPTS